MSNLEAGTSRKRARRASNEPGGTLSRDSMPPFPDVTSTLLLQVFTDKSLGAPFSNDEELDESIYGDNQRLAVMGERVVDLAATHVAYLEKPPLRPEDLEKRREELISDHNLQHWAWHYKLRERIRCLPDVRSSLCSPRETRNIFNALCAAVYLECGIQVLTNWLYELTHEGEKPSATSITVNESGPPQKKQRPQPDTPPVHH